MKLNIDEKTMDSPFAGYPWRHMKVRSRSINPIRSLMSADESLYLHWLAREYYQGKGKIIDGGPLLGGSTVALASGLEKNEKVFAKHKRIHSYDTFIYYDYMAGVCPPGLREGDNLLSFFRQNTQKYEDYIEVHAGDILQMHWNGNPIEILFLDIVKSGEINNHVIREFFGHLIPNRSIVVHTAY